MFFFVKKDNTEIESRKYNVVNILPDQSGGRYFT